MNDFLNVARTEYEAQKALMDSINNALACNAVGRIIEKRSKNGKLLQYYEYPFCENGRTFNKRRLFIPEEAELKHALMRRKAAKKLRRQVEKNSEVLAGLIENYSAPDIDCASLLFQNSFKASNVLDGITGDKQIKWRVSQETDAEYRPDGRIHEYKGVRFRSKGELIIGTRLAAFGVPYITEPILTLGKMRYHPDFLVRNIRSGRIFFWEHLGMMDSIDYRKANANKLDIYADYGILPNYNLIITCEFPGIAEIDVEQIDSIIKAWLL